MNDTGKWRGERKRGFIFFLFKCEMWNIQVPNEKVWTGKQLYLNPLLLWACSTHGLTSPLAFQKWRETFPLLLGTYGHVWTVSEAAGCAQTWPNCFSQRLPNASGQKTDGISSTTQFLPTHFATLSSVTLFLLVKSCFPSNNKSKLAFLSLLF